MENVKMKTEYGNTLKEDLSQYLAQKSKGFPLLKEGMDPSEAEQERVERLVKNIGSECKVYYNPEDNWRPSHWDFRWYCVELDNTWRIKFDNIDVSLMTDTELSSMLQQLTYDAYEDISQKNLASLTSEDKLKVKPSNGNRPGFFTEVSSLAHLPVSNTEAWYIASKKLASYVGAKTEDDMVRVSNVLDTKFGDHLVQAMSHHYKSATLDAFCNALDKCLYEEWHIEALADLYDKLKYEPGLHLEPEYAWSFSFFQGGKSILRFSDLEA